MSEVLQPAEVPPGGFAKIDRFVVLMMENRSFDHLLGFLKTSNAQVEGLIGTESNPQDPDVPGSPMVPVARATSFVMPFDPGHEFPDVQVQLYGSSPAASDSARMNGFVKSATKSTGSFPADGLRIMECFDPSQLAVFSTLAQQFAIFNFYYSSLPGPTWPNRFFVHAATSGGLTDSPDTDQILGGYSFKNGTIYDALTKAGKDWRIYHDGLPQSAGIESLRLAYVDPFTTRFREMNLFAQDVFTNSLPDYTFIEPNYDTGHNYQNGNSMHPLNDIREGEKLIKLVYETLRSSTYWERVMLIITFDEHGGFYDHVPPPAAVPTGDDATYANPAHNFDFDRLGIRIPTIVVSAYTPKGLVIGSDPNNPKTTFDHGSVLATVEKCFGLPELTARDKTANTLDIALQLENARNDAPMTLPDPVGNIA